MKSNRGVKSVIVSLLLYLAFTTSCYYETITPELPEPPEGDVSFATEIQPIFTAKCISCHPTMGGLDLTEGNAYSNINDPKYINSTTPAESLIYTKADASGSHPAKYTAAESLLLLTWIEQGANNN
ncbi:MAG: hypothetical protein ABFS32_11670 [Bacteroidota bacterium]